MYRRYPGVLKCVKRKSWSAWWSKSILHSTSLLIIKTHLPQIFWWWSGCVLGHWTDERRKIIKRKTMKSNGGGSRRLSCGVNILVQRAKNGRQTYQILSFSLIRWFLYSLVHVNSNPNNFEASLFEHTLFHSCCHHVIHNIYILCLQGRLAFEVQTSMVYPGGKTTDTKPAMTRWEDKTITQDTQKDEKEGGRQQPALSKNSKIQALLVSFKNDKQLHSVY